VRSRRRAFTIVELLVVISIILVLVALLLPALGVATRSAMEYACQNNLHELAVVVATYCADNEGYFPHATGTGVISSANDWLYVPDRLSSQAYLKDGILLKQRRVGSTDQYFCDLYYCPVDVDNGLQRTGNYIGRRFRPPKCPTSYVINGSITYGNTLFGGRERRVRRFSEFDPTDFLFIEESEASNFDQAYMTPESAKYTITNRHHGGGYVAYMDGSVQWWSQDDFNAEADRVTSGGTEWWKVGSDTPNHWNPG